MIVRNLICSLILLVGFSAFGQIKGKALKLVGTWKYDQGSGYEIWELKDGLLIGSGYRSTKFGDSVKVEDIKIELVNNNLIYSLKTQQVMASDSTESYKFIGNKKKLYFVNIESELPRSIKYKFCFFSKNKLQIIIQIEDKNKAKKLKLTRVKD